MLIADISVSLDVLSIEKLFGCLLKVNKNIVIILKKKKKKKLFKNELFRKLFIHKKSKRKNKKINPNYLPTHYKVLDDDFFFFFFQLNSVLFV